MIDALYILSVPLGPDPESDGGGGVPRMKVPNGVRNSTAIRAFVDHYHRERSHQGLENRLIEPDESPRHANGEIRCRERLGGLLRYYYRDAA